MDEKSLPFTLPPELNMHLTPIVDLKLDETDAQLLSKAAWHLVGSDHAVLVGEELQQVDDLVYFLAAEYCEMLVRASDPSLSLDRVTEQFTSHPLPTVSLSQYIKCSGEVVLMASMTLSLIPKHVVNASTVHRLILALYVVLQFPQIQTRFKKCTVGYDVSPSVTMMMSVEEMNALELLVIVHTNWKMIWPRQHYLDGLLNLFHPFIIRTFSCANEIQRVLNSRKNVGRAVLRRKSESGLVFPKRAVPAPPAPKQFFFSAPRHHFQPFFTPLKLSPPKVAAWPKPDERVIVMPLHKQVVVNPPAPPPPPPKPPADKMRKLRIHHAGWKKTNCEAASISPK